MKYRPAWKDRMDARVRKIVHARGFCVRCGRTDGLTAAHIERRRFYGTRWDPSAILCLCLWCHTWFDTNRAEAHAWLVAQIGQDAVDDIHRRRDGMPEVQEVESDLARWSHQTGSPLPGDHPSSGGVDPVASAQGPAPIIGRGR